MHRISPEIMRQSLTNEGARFSTPRMTDNSWKSISTYGTDVTPWWIYQEEIKQRDTKIYDLERRIQQQDLTLRQSTTQWQQESTKHLRRIRSLHEEIGLLRKQNVELESQSKQQTYNNELLRGLHMRIENFERTIIPIQTPQKATYVVLQFEDYEGKDFLDPDHYAEGTKEG